MKAGVRYLSEIFYIINHWYSNHYVNRGTGSISNPLRGNVTCLTALIDFIIAVRSDMVLAIVS